MQKIWVGGPYKQELCSWKKLLIVQWKNVLDHRHIVDSLAYRVALNTNEIDTNQLPPRLAVQGVVSQIIREENIDVAVISEPYRNHPGEIAVWVFEEHAFQEIMEHPNNEFEIGKNPQISIYPLHLPSTSRCWALWFYTQDGTSDPSISEGELEVYNGPDIREGRFNQ